MTPTSVAGYYANKTIFITGATGFLGKVLVEKLLRCCPDLKTIYLLMREKKGQSSSQRLEGFLKCPVFNRLHEFNPECLKKLRLVPGDILADGFGISDEHREELVKTCQIIFHCAACVRFDMPIKDAAALNIGGTQRVLDLAANMPQLEVCVHVSTAYCHSELPELEERVYSTHKPQDVVSCMEWMDEALLAHLQPKYSSTAYCHSELPELEERVYSTHKPQDVVSCTEWMDDALLAHLQPKLIEPLPNTYAYTKALSESLVAQYEGRFPIVIARPSIVTAALKEPMPGWVDNLNGATGLFVGAGKGAIRSIYTKEGLICDLVPVDLVVNGCILAGYNAGLTRPKVLQVVNITNSKRNPVTLRAMIDMGRVHVQEFPFSQCVWCPGGSLKSSRLQHQLAVLLTHLLPAYLLDLLLLILGKKTFMVKTQRRISAGLEAIQYYWLHEWRFHNQNYLALRTRISSEDDATFYTDIKMVNWNSYIRDYMYGARTYCCQEDPATLPRAQRLHKRLYYLDWAAKIIFYSLCAYFLYYYIGRFLTIM